MQDKQPVYPVTKETIHKYAQDIFTPIRRGECVTTVWVPMAGRRMWNKFIIENIALFEKELPHYDKYLLVYIEPLDLTEESLVGYLRLMAQSFIEVVRNNDITSGNIKQSDIDYFSDQNTSYSDLLFKLKKLLKDITDLGVEVVFFIGEFDELNFANKVFFNNLKSIWSQLYPRLHYVFLMRERVTQKRNVDQWGELNEAILQNIIFVPLGCNEDINYWLNFFTAEYNLKLSDMETEFLKRVCGGHPYMLKVAVRVINKYKDADLPPEKLQSILLGYYELISVCRAIYDIQGEKERAVLGEIALYGKLEKETNRPSLVFLKNLGIVAGTKEDGYEFFSDIFKQTVIDNDQADEKTVKISQNTKKLTYHPDTKTIVFGDKSVEEYFTRQEYLVMDEFMQKEGQLLKRDDVGSVLWGKNSLEMYSDWAIDQLVSKIRKKLKSIGTETKLITIRGVGYKCV